MNSTHWDFEDISSDTIVRPSKSKSTEDKECTTPTSTTPTSSCHSGNHVGLTDRSLVSNHHDNATPNHDVANHRGGSSGSQEGVVTDGECGEDILGIEDTVFASSDTSPQQRSSIVGEPPDLQSKRGSTISVEGSSGLIAVSGAGTAGRLSSRGVTLWVWFWTGRVVVVWLLAGSGWDGACFLPRGATAGQLLCRGVVSI